LSRLGFGSGVVVGAVVVAVVWLGSSGLLRTSSGRINAGYDQIRSIHLQPGEGPSGPMFVPRPRASGDLPLALVRNLVPSQLPAPLDQGHSCSAAGSLIVVLRSGREITYGPCRWPWEISQLWGAMIEVGHVIACPNRQSPADFCQALRTERG
jgi:hypothetical protein